MKRLQRTHLQARSRCRSWCISTEIFCPTGLHSCWSDFVSQPIGNDAMNRQQAPRKNGADQRALMTFRSTCSYYQCILTNLGSEHTARNGCGEQTVWATLSSPTDSGQRHILGLDFRTWHLSSFCQEQISDLKQLLGRSVAVHPFHERYC